MLLMEGLESDTKFPTSGKRLAMHGREADLEWLWDKVSFVGCLLLICSVAQIKLLIIHHLAKGVFLHCQVEQQIRLVKNNVGIDGSQCMEMLVLQGCSGSGRESPAPKACC